MPRRVLHVKIAQEPLRGPYIYSKCYWPIGAKVYVRPRPVSLSHGIEPFEATVVAHRRNKFGRVSYVVTPSVCYKTLSGKNGCREKYWVKTEWQLEDLVPEGAQCASG